MWAGSEGGRGRPGISRVRLGRVRLPLGTSSPQRPQTRSSPAQPAVTVLPSAQSPARVPQSGQNLNDGAIASLHPPHVSSGGGAGAPAAEPQSTQKLKEDGFEVYNDMFGAEFGAKFRASFDCVFGANCFAHIDDMRGIIRQTETILNSCTLKKGKKHGFKKPNKKYVLDS